MPLTPVTLNNNEVDIPVGKEELVEFVVAEGEVIVIHNPHPFETVQHQVSNDMERQWFALKPGDYAKIDKTMFFRTLRTEEDVVLTTDRA